MSPLWLFALAGFLCACCFFAGAAIIVCFWQMNAVTRYIYGGEPRDNPLQFGGHMLGGIVPDNPWQIKRMSPEELRTIARANGGRVRIVRLDDETGEWIEETITSDMPDSEIVT